MKPSEGAWEAHYWELVARQTILYAKPDIDRDEWLELIADFQAHNVWGLANDMLRQFELRGGERE